MPTTPHCWTEHFRVQWFLKKSEIINKTRFLTLVHGIPFLMLACANLWQVPIWARIGQKSSCNVLGVPSPPFSLKYFYLFIISGRTPVRWLSKAACCRMHTSSSVRVDSAQEVSNRSILRAVWHSCVHPVRWEDGFCPFYGKTV